MIHSPIDILQGRRLLLASGSPRRRELIEQLDIPVEVAPLRRIKEYFPENIPVEEVPAYISREKAEGYADLLTGRDVLLTADTIVMLDGQVIGKPRDAEDARRMLRRLSGKTHTVITGVTLLWYDEPLEANPIKAADTRRAQRITFTERTEVTFADLSDEEINHYVDEYEPLDKAGAYGIQEWIGYIGIETIHGDFYNVMGLPIRTLYRYLKAIPK